MEAVTALEAALFGLDAWSADRVRTELLGDRGHAWVVGDPAEAYAVTSVAGDVADLERIGVHPDLRRRGVARTLLDRAVAQGRADGAVRLLLEVAANNDGGLAFYAEAGFVEIARRRRYYRDGADAVVMERALRT